ncbi:hypothetical protein Gotri_027417, partial [Gossypium trilobum]|nr:hypothetical protein [Gossypium trilobum]
MRKGKNKAKEDLDSLKIYYKKQHLSMRTVRLDVNAQCEYHAGITGHSIENCTAFKKLIEKFIKMGIVRFDDPLGPNVAGNSLPSHSDQGVNAIIESGGKRTKTDVAEECAKFRALVQRLMDNKELKFFEDVKGLEGGYVCTS